MTLNAEYAVKSGCCTAGYHAECHGRYKGTTVDPTTWLRCECSCHGAQNDSSGAES